MPFHHPRPLSSSSTNGFHSPLALLLRSPSEISANGAKNDLYENNRHKKTPALSSRGFFVYGDPEGT